MIQATVDRLAGLVLPEHVLIVTNSRLVDAIAEQLPELPRDSILGEPCKRDTAPCIGLAALEISRHDPDAIMAVMPADHVIRPAATFVRSIQFAARLVAESPGRIATFGIKPTYAAESFGYIERGARWRVCRPARLLRLPSSSSAKSPRPSWPASIWPAATTIGTRASFCGSARTILERFERHEPEMYAHLSAIAAARGQRDYAQVLEREFTAIRPISIDYAVMERAQDVVVIEAPYEWDDVGSWQAMAGSTRPTPKATRSTASTWVWARAAASFARRRIIWW